MQRGFNLLPRWSLVIFAALTILSAAVALAAPQSSPASQVSGGIGVDPLSPSEVDAALAAVQAQRGVTAASIRASQPQVAGQTPIVASAEETVLVERHREEKAVMAAGNWERKADVYVYRYSDDMLVHAVYNYASGSTEQIEELKGVQYPLTADERKVATELAFGDPATLAYMQEEYHRITGGELTAPDQVEIRAFVYHAGANPETEPPEAAVCGVQRCAQLLIVTRDNVTFEGLPIVNLSSLQVASILPVAVDTSIAPPNSQQSAPDGHSH